MNCSPANGGDGLCAYHYICTIFRKGVEMCRLSIANGNGASNEAVQLEAAEKARAWIATFLLRPDEAQAFGRE
ncbi:MAG: hypothetical protein JSS14_04980 [Proteobacteria bacterium]|nr:hypothetical protein [Pseudomonadota bacterium]